MPQNTNEHKVTVTIYGEEYPIVGYSDPSYISKIADLVDTRMKETAKSSKIAARDKVAILSALSIASELFEKRDELGTIENDFAGKVDSLIARIDNVL